MTHPFCDGALFYLDHFVQVIEAVLDTTRSVHQSRADLMEERDCAGVREDAEEDAERDWSEFF